MLIIICSILLFNGMVYAEGVQDLTKLLQLFGESGVTSLHLDQFSFTNIDFDQLLNVIGHSRIDFSRLNYDAFLEFITTPEILIELGIDSIDQEALLVWLKDPSTEKSLNKMMLTVKNGGSFSECVQGLYDDTAFLESFSSITNGKEFHTVLDRLSTENVSGILNKAAAALLTPRSGQPSETAMALSKLVQSASDTLGWK